MGPSTRFLSEPEAMALVEPYGVSFPASIVVSSASEAKQAAARLEEPLVMKIVSPDIQHKTDVGGVMLGIRTRDAAVSYDRLIETVAKRSPRATIGGVLMQSQIAKGVEIIAGVKRDREFGHVLLLGAGGIFAELLNEVSLQLVPVDEDRARRMIEETSAYALLSGVRGRPRADTEALCRILVALSRIAQDHPEIAELDMNPILVHTQGATAVDALILIDDERVEEETKEDV